MRRALLLATGLGAVAGWLALPASAQQAVVRLCVRAASAPPGPDTVTLDPAQRFQFVGGWGASLSFMRDQSYVSQAAVDQMIDEAVHDLGLTFLRIGAGRLTEHTNENADPHVADLGAFDDVDTIDWELQQGGLGRFRAAVVANGEVPRFLMNTEPEQPAWMSDDELAEHFAANALAYRARGVDVDWYSIYNEPDLHAPENTPAGAFTAARQRAILPLMGQQFARYGLATKAALAENFQASSALAYAQAMDQPAWDAIGLLNWHGYGTNDPYRAQLYATAQARGLPAAMTEWGGANPRDLFDDIALGGVSYWMHLWFSDKGAGSFMSPSNWFASAFDGTSFVKNYLYYHYRQVMRYARPGAQRIGAASNNAAIQALAFEKAGARTVVLRNSSGTPVTMTVAGLPPGTYGVSQTTGLQYAELGTRAVSGSTAVTVNGNEILTVYPVAANQRAHVVRWGAVPTYLTAPQAGVALSIEAQDTELDPLAYSWAVTSQPAGAATVLASPASAATSASGMSVSGTYVFTGTVTDAAGPSSRTVTVVRYAANQPPTIVKGARFFRTERVVQPASNFPCGPGLIFSFDLEGDAVTNVFSVVSQPAGASAAFAGTNAVGLTVPGAYVFRLTATAVGGSRSQDFGVTVVPAASTPSVPLALVEPADGAEVGRPVALRATAPACATAVRFQVDAAAGVPLALVPGTRAGAEWAATWPGAVGPATVWAVADLQCALGGRATDALSRPAAVVVR
jgi:O-glycosyl hydrolase